MAREKGERYRSIPPTQSHDPTTLKIVMWKTVVIVMTLGPIKTIEVRGVYNPEVPREVKREKGQGMKSNLGEKSH